MKINILDHYMAVLQKDSVFHSEEWSRASFATVERCDIYAVKRVEGNANIKDIEGKEIV